MLRLNSVGIYYILNSPLNVISETKSSFATKVIAVIAIAILSVVTLGLYSLHAYRVLSRKDVIVNASSKQSTDIEKLKKRASQIVDEGKL